jgi:hypothetical protein
MFQRFSSVVTGLLVAAGCFSSNLSGAAPTLSWHTWDPYRDRFGLINSVLVDQATHNPSTNNGPLYTAEACVIMQLRKVAYDRNAIASAIASCEVEKGLYRHSPTDPQDQDTVDDYIGLGALAGVCGFHDIAQDILQYGNGGEQAVRETVLGLDPVKTAKGWLGLLRNGLNASPVGNIVPYNYNNIQPGKFTEASWMGRYPALIVHWKLGAGQAPSEPEIVIWSAALEYSARTNMKSDSPQDPWLQSWLMVLTYQMSGVRSTVADAAVANWWKLMHQRWPGGIKQAMTTYLSNGATGNPLADYIEDFQDAHGSFAEFVDSGDDEKDLVSSVENLLSSLSPTDFLAPFDTAVASYWTAINVQQKAVDLQASAVDKGTQTVNSISKSIDDLNTQKDDAAKKLTNALAEKANMLAQHLDKIRLPGHFETPKAWGVPIGPPVFVPGPWQANAAFTTVVQSITDSTNLVNNIDNEIVDFTSKKQQAASNLVASTTNLVNAKAGLGLAVEAAKKAAPLIEKAQDALAKAEAVVFNLIPGVALSADSPPQEPQAAPSLFVLPGVQLLPWLQQQLEKDAESFQKQTGLSMTIISGPRTAKEQAASMYDCMKASGDAAQYVSVYRDQVTVQKVLRAFKANVNDRDAATAEMARIMAKTIGTNKPFSNHFYDGGYDIKTEGLTDEQKEQLLKVLIEPSAGGEIVDHPHSNNQIIIAVPRDQLAHAREIRDDLWKTKHADSSRIGVEFDLHEHVHVNVLKPTQAGAFPDPDVVVMPKCFTVDYYPNNSSGHEGRSVWTWTNNTTWQERRNDGSLDTFRVIYTDTDVSNYYRGGPCQIVRSLSNPDQEFVISDMQANPTLNFGLRSQDNFESVGKDIKVIN